MKKLKLILLSLFVVVMSSTTIILIVYLATFNKGVSSDVTDWDLFFSFYNGITISVLTMANIWVFYKLTIAIEDRNKDRHIRSKLYDTQKILTNLRINEYINLKNGINDLYTNSFKSNDISTTKNTILSILMRMQNSILFCCSDSLAASKLDKPIEQILENIKENMTEESYNKINTAMSVIEICIFEPLFDEKDAIRYIRKHKDGIDPTILAIDKYLSKKLMGNV